VQRIAARGVLRAMANRHQKGIEWICRHVPRTPALRGLRWRLCPLRRIEL